MMIILPPKRSTVCNRVVIVVAITSFNYGHLPSSNLWISINHSGARTRTRGRIHVGVRYVEMEDEEKKTNKMSA